jgi:hypothetical protein
MQRTLTHHLKHSQTLDRAGEPFGGAGLMADLRHSLTVPAAVSRVTVRDPLWAPSAYSANKSHDMHSEVVLKRCLHGGVPFIFADFTAVGCTPSGAWQSINWAVRCGSRKAGFAYPPVAPPGIVCGDGRVCPLSRDRSGAGSIVVRPTPFIGSACRCRARAAADPRGSGEPVGGCHPSVRAH